MFPHLIHSINRLTNSKVTHFCPKMFKTEMAKIRLDYSCVCVGMCGILF